MGKTASLANIGTIADSSLGFRNRLINSDMRIDQRNAGASVTPTGGSYTLDRWQVVASAASKFSIQQNAGSVANGGSVVAPTGFTNWLGATSLSAYTVGASETFNVFQKIEGFNTSDLAWGTASASAVTLSFRVYSSLTGSFGGFLQNSASDRFYSFSYSISSANTWTTISVTISGDTTGTWLTTNGVGIRLGFSLGTGSSYSGSAGSWGSSLNYAPTGSVSVVGTNGATFYITGVQLEKGSTATSFDYRPYSTELQLAQRYYQKTYDIGEMPGTNTSASYWAAGTMAIDSTNTWGASWRFPVEMRATPTTTAYTSAGTAGSLGYAYRGSSGSGAITPFGVGAKAISYYHNATASGLTAGDAIILIGHIVASAEL